MSEELEVQGQELAPPVAAVEGATELEPTAVPAEEPTAEPPTRVELTEFPEFRSWQSQADRRVAALQAQLASEQERAKKAQEERDRYEQHWVQTQIADTDPQQVAAYYQQQIQKEREEYRQAQEAQTQQAEMQRRASEYLAKVGVAPDTPGLDWSGGPSYEGLVTLMDSVGGVLAREQKELATKAEATRQAAARKAKQDALQQAGVPNVSTATGAPASSLRNRYEQEKSQLKNTGDWTSLVELNLKYRKEGLDV
jgi:hypothetical protein